MGLVCTLACPGTEFVFIMSCVSSMVGAGDSELVSEYSIVRVDNDV